MSGDKLLELALLYGEKNFDMSLSFMSGLKKNSSSNSNVEERDFSNAKLEETLRHKVHPKQVVLCNDAELYFCEIEYSYTTNRNNDRVNKKVFVFNECDLSKVDLQKDLLEKWVVDFNKKNPLRQLSNIKLIDNSFFNIDEFLELNLNRNKVVFCCGMNWGSYLNLSFTKIDYKYSTPKNNIKESSKILIYVGSINPQRDMKPELMNWVNKSNNENTKKSLLNVKILKSDNLGYIKL